MPAAVIIIGNILGRLVRGEQHGFVAGDRGHRRKHVHALGAGDARDQLHREERCTALGQLLHELRIAERVAHADDGEAVVD